MEIQEQDAPSRDLLSEPLEVLPPVQFAFSYGSGVFPQSNSIRNDEKPMVDYILGVASSDDWHTKNIEKNPHHYTSWLAKLGGRWVSDFADNVGVGVHFNPFVPWEDKMIKYGVIGVEKLKEDITTWNSLYISGRLQKPTCILVDKDDLKQLNHANLKAALYAALLLTPQEFTEEELYMNICRLSYLGDIRMFFAEDRLKVEKIVKGSMKRFREMYWPQLQDAAKSDLLRLPGSFGTKHLPTFRKVTDRKSVTTLVAGLPERVMSDLGSQTAVTWQGKNSNLAIAEATALSAEGPEKLVRRAISRIVRKSSLRQSISGLFAAGGVNAVQYLFKKTAKAWRSWKA